MTQALRILFYDDAPDFGGHELMTLAAVRYIASQPNIEVGFVYFRGNVRLGRQIADLAAHNRRVRPLPQDYASLRFQAFRTLLSGRAIQRIADTIADYAPDVLVAAQGSIAFGSAGLLAAKRAGVPSISYIPMTHPERMFSASRLKAALREPVNRIYYRLPAEYITISPRMETYLRRKGLQQPVAVVPVAIDTQAYAPVDRESARAKWGFAPDDRVVALVGRVQFWQKRQDLAVKALALARRQMPKLKLLVVGDGPDLAALKALVHDEAMQDSVVFAGWTDGLSSVYSAIDALAIPSRYEGVPLVMLEAMHCRRPVIASAVDGMADVLPAHWLFPSGDASAFAARLVQVLGASESVLLDVHRQRVLAEFSQPVFECGFLAAIRLALTRIGRAPTPR